MPRVHKSFEQASNKLTDRQRRGQQKLHGRLP